MSEEAGEAVPTAQKSSWSAFLKQILASTGDLSSMTAPSFILSPVSLVEFPAYWGEAYDELINIAQGQTSEERMLLVVKWFISTLKGQYMARETQTGSEKKPLNPVLGELFFGSWDTTSSGTTHLVAEQVSHHPPITAFHIENKQAKVVLTGHFAQKTSFTGKTIYVKQVGFAKIQVGLADSTEETYVITLPRLRIDGLLLGKPYVELTESQYIQSSSGFHTVINYEGKGYFSGKAHTFKATVSPSPHHTNSPLYVIGGQWDQTSTYTKGTRGKYAKEGEVFLHVPDVQKSWKPISVKPVSEQGSLESRKVWHDVAEGIKRGDFETAGVAKSKIENEQRAKRKEEASSGAPWKLQMFEHVTDDQDYAAQVKKFTFQPTQSDFYSYKADRAS